MLSWQQASGSSICDREDQSLPFDRQLDYARRGESEALSALYRRFLPGVSAYIAGRVPDRATAEDLTSEVFLEMVEGISKFRASDEAAFAAWILKIVRITVAGYYRKREKQPAFVTLDSTSLQEERRNADPVRWTEARDEWSAVVNAINALTAEQRQVLIGRLILGYDVATVARMIGKNANAVKALQFRALHSLQRLLRICILLLLLATSVLVAASHISHPANPLHAVEPREQRMQPALANSPANRADLELQLAQDQLNSLTDLARSAGPNAYRQGLIDLDQQFNAAAQAIDALPAGLYQDHLASKLALLKADTRRTLRGLLLQLTLPERLVTTVELGRLGDSVPHLKSVEIILPKDPHGQATISITGDDLQPGAQLLVNGQLVKASGFLQSGVYIFVVNWSSSQLPQSIGILNPDGTATQTTVIILKNLAGLNISKGKGNGNGSGNRSSSNHGKSEGKDTGNGSGNGHGNNNGKSKRKSSGNGNNNGKGEGKGNGNSNGHGNK